MKKIKILLGCTLLMSISTFAQGPEAMIALENTTLKEYDQNTLESSHNTDDLAGEIGSIQVQLQPNPKALNKSLLMISNMSDVDKNMNIILRDSFGSIISERNITYSDNELNIPIGELDRLNSGMYYVQVQIDDANFNRKLLIE